MALEGPFVYCGLDIFGHFFFKEGRKQYKRYVALFTCRSSRAIHLEPVKDMGTDSFINSLCRFVCRRGPVRSIQSDNGSNFVGAERELKKAFGVFDHKRISNTLVDDNCDWITWLKNPPYSSHMGGVW